MRLTDGIADEAVVIRNLAIPLFQAKFQSLDCNVTSDVPQNVIEETVKIVTEVERISGELGLVDACTSGKKLCDWI